MTQKQNSILLSVAFKASVLVGLYVGGNALVASFREADDQELQQASDVERITAITKRQILEQRRIGKKLWEIGAQEVKNKAPGVIEDIQRGLER